MSTMSNALSCGFSTRGYGVCYSQPLAPDGNINGINFYNSGVNNQQSSNHQIQGASNMINIDNTIFINKYVARVGIANPAPGFALDVAGTVNALTLIATGSVLTPTVSLTSSGGSNPIAGNLWMTTATNYISSAGSIISRRMATSTINIGSVLTSTPQFALYVQTDSAAKPGTSTWTTASDDRVKNFITLADLDTCYSTIKAIPLKRYQWNIPDLEMYDRNVLGYVAQDIELMFPKSVEQQELFGLSDMRMLNVDQINKALHGAVQKLMAKVEELEARVATLESN